MKSNAVDFPRMKGADAGVDDGHALSENYKRKRFMARIAVKGQELALSLEVTIGKGAWIIRSPCASTRNRK
jgi:hypothetical protein